MSADIDEALDWPRRHLPDCQISPECLCAVFAHDRLCDEVRRLRSRLESAERVVEAAKGVACAGEHDGYCDKAEIELAAALSSHQAATKDVQETK